MRAPQLLKVMIAVWTLAFVAGGTYVSYSVVERQKALGEISSYNMASEVSQAISEYYRFEQRVAGFELGTTTRDDLIQSHNQLTTRIAVFHDRAVQMFIATRAMHRSAVHTLITTVERIGPQLATLSGPGVLAVQAQLATLEPALSQLAVDATEYGADQAAADQHALLHLHWTFSAIAAGLLVCGLAFIIMLFMQHRMLGAAHRDLSAMAEDLKVAKNEAEAGSEAKSRFLATMSHELRTPLNAVIGFSEIISNQSLGPVGQPKYLDYAGDIIKAGRHMFEIVSDVLTMAKLDANRYEIAAETVSLKETAEMALSMFRGTEIAQGRQIALDPKSEWLSVEADKRAIRQMLLNLMSNAAKFSEPETPILLACRRAPSGDVLVSVSDRGIGMTADQAQKVVQPFYQADDTLARRYEGSGLGLSIVSGLLKCHGGRLDIESNPGAGSTVTLVFPVSRVPALAMAEAA